MADTSLRAIAFLSATELLERYRRKTLSPVEVTETLLRRLDRLEPRLNAFVFVARESALAEARAAEARWAKGAPQGLLDGVPVTIKDLFLTRGWPTLRGSTLVKRDQPWEEDAPAVARLREQGAVLLGKTTMPEFGWKALGDSPLTGITRNPWSLAHTPGGSSSGGAAALAAGIGPLALGTDGGGSIRIPCAFTGLYGLKPSFGRVPQYPQSVFGMVAHSGPMARSVADLALLLTVMTGADDRDVYALPPDPHDYRQSLEDGVKGLRIAFSPALGYARVDPEIAATVARAAQRFAELGARVETVERVFDDPAQAWLTLWFASAAKAMSAFSAVERQRIDPGLEASAQKGAGMSAVDYVGADVARSALSLRMVEFHRRFDLLLTPSVAVPALKAGELLSDPRTQKEWIDWAPFSYPFNLTRQPGASVPCGLTKAGLPVGLQIIGRRHEDALVLRAARAFEQAEPWAPCPLE
ncbi:MAG TPA: amidase [Stellaceae bacterium]|nr:amidase [Stellaceae bacterium]